MDFTVCDECVPSGNYVTFATFYFPTLSSVCLSVLLVSIHSYILLRFRFLLQFYRLQLQLLSVFFFFQIIHFEYQKAGVSYRVLSCPFSQVSLLLLLKKKTEKIATIAISWLSQTFKIMADTMRQKLFLQRNLCCHL